MLKAILSKIYRATLVSLMDEATLTIDFPETKDDLDEDSKVKEPSVFDALRLIQHSFDTSNQHKHALFLGGLFAYDLVANFEPLGAASRIDNCPDYVFYLAETLVTVDHQANTCDVQASLFINDTNERERLQQRVADIVKHCEKTMPLPAAASVTNLELKYSLSDVEFSELVSELKQYVVQGDVFQVVPSRRFFFSLPCPSPLVAYKELNRVIQAHICSSCKTNILLFLVLRLKALLNMM